MSSRYTGDFVLREKKVTTEIYRVNIFANQNGFIYTIVIVLLNTFIFVVLNGAEY